MNDAIRSKICEKLRELADKVEKGETTINEISIFRHYIPCLNDSNGMYTHSLTGDDAIQFRIKSTYSDIISVTDLDGRLK